MLIAGLRLTSDTTAEWRQAWTSTGFASFMLQATKEIPRVFGPEVEFGLALFRYPNRPGMLGPECECREGTMREAYYDGDGWADEHLYGLLAREWRDRRTGRPVAVG